jgi:hypothetical protein
VNQKYPNDQPLLGKTNIEICIGSRIIKIPMEYLLILTLLLFFINRKIRSKKTEVRVSQIENVASLESKRLAAPRAPIPSNGKSVSVIIAGTANNELIAATCVKRKSRD